MHLPRSPLGHMLSKRFSLLQNYLSSRGMSWRHMLQEALQAVQQGLYQLSGNGTLSYWGSGTAWYKGRKSQYSYRFWGIRYAHFYGREMVIFTSRRSLLLLTLLFSHLADAFIQSDLRIRKSNYNYKLKLYKYYIYTFKKMEKWNKMTNAYNNI